MNCKKKKKNHAALPPLNPKLARLRCQVWLILEVGNGHQHTFSSYFLFLCTTVVAGQGDLRTC